MNYKLIMDEQKLNEFIALLPELKENESYFIILIARRKWNKVAEIPATIKLKRESVLSKSKIIKTIKNWQLELGTFEYNNLIIEPENLGVYLAYNPKNQLKACYTLIEKCLEKIKNNYVGINVKSIANDAIQVSSGTKNFLDIDVDIKNDEKLNYIIEDIKKCLGLDKELILIKTRGGFHCLVPTKNLNGNWHSKIIELNYKSDINIMSDDLVPLVGCRQGDYIPFIIK